MNKRAVLEDLLQEQWIRDRNSGNIVWVTKNGESIPIKDMTDQHLQNAINLLSEHEDIIINYS